MQKHKREGDKRKRIILLQNKQHLRPYLQTSKSNLYLCMINCYSLFFACVNLIYSYHYTIILFYFTLFYAKLTHFHFNLLLLFVIDF